MSGVAEGQPESGSAVTADGRSLRERLAFWRSPAGQPAWARPVLLAIAAAAMIMYGWNLPRAGLAPFYSVAVRSMSESWKAFFYGAFDPAATITIDKLAGSFLPQALSARIFGFHAWSLALPQVIEGVVSVLVMYRVVRRWAGAVPGLLAAAIFALTPVAASMFGHSMEDGALTMCLVLAADSYQRAVTEGRLRSLLWSGVWVGLGFQAKMLQAWMILPALGVGYLVAARPSLRRRLAHLAMAAVVMLAVSLSWIALYTFTPARDRPYVDGSTNNSAFAMVFGYNGLERFGITVPGAVSSGPGITVGQTASGRETAQAQASSGASGTGSGTSAGSGTSGQTVTGTAPGGGPGGGAGGGLAKLVGTRFGPEIGWLYPLALMALVFGLWSRRRSGRPDRLRGGFVMWGTWLLTFGVIYSAMSTIPHTAYMAALAPPLAALSGAGIVTFWNWYRTRAARGWLLPAAVAAEAAWTAYLWSGYGSFLPWVMRAVLVAGLATAAVLALARIVNGRPGRRERPGQPGLMASRLVKAALVLGVAAMLAAPAAWALSVFNSRYAGSSFDAAAGPVSATAGAGRTTRALGALGRLGKMTRSSEQAPGAAAAMPSGSGTGNSRPPAGPAGEGSLPGAAGGGISGAGISGAGASGAASAGAAGPGGGLSASTTLTSSQRRLYDYVSAHRGSATYLMAVESWGTASPYILATGQEVLPLGGFSGSVPSPTLAWFQRLVRTGQLKFVLLSGTSSTGSGLGGAGLGAGQGTRTGGTASQEQKIVRWVRSSCTASTSGVTGVGTLYRCGASS